MTDVYAAAEAVAQESPLLTNLICEVLAVSPSAYYAWRKGRPSPRAKRDAELAPVVRAMFWKHRRRYGARRIASELADRGETCGPRRVAKLLKNQGLHAIQPQIVRAQNDRQPTSPGLQHGCLLNLGRYH